MGPTMPPSRKAQSPSSGASPPYQQGGGGGGLAVAAASEAEAADLSLSLSASFSKAEDEELTSLSWLHEGTDLLSSFSHSGLRSVSPLQQDADGQHHHHHHHHASRSPSSPSPSPDDPLLGGDAHSPYDLASAAAMTGATRKPPYSFSCLIFMAIEDAPNKRLPVKDIYGWILEHFPYFASAPTGWKNSVRHNLSLNKCFKKVDKDRSQSIGKGSLWSIDPEYRHNLIQALKKTPYHPYSPGLATPSTSPPTLTQTYQPSPPLWSGSPLFRKNGGVLLQGTIFAFLEPPSPRSVIQNGARVRNQGLFPVIRPLPVSPVGSRTTTIRSVNFDLRPETISTTDCQSGDEDAQDDHTYSTAKSPSRSCSSSQGGPDSSPRCSPLEDDFNDDDIIAVEIGAEEVKPEPREIPLDLHVAAATATFLTQQPLRAQRRGSGAGAVAGSTAGGSLPWTKNRLRGVSDTLPLKKRRAATAAVMVAAMPVESDDEEMKEAAGSLLHLAGVRACLNNITNRTAKGQKEQKETLRN
ncbi:unnamed protein product [Lota lota]